MRLTSSSNSASRGRQAFTLVEILVVMVTLVIIIGAVIMANLFGLAMATRQQIWIGTTDDAAQAVGTLMGDIRSAISLQVGTYATNGGFTAATTNVQQSGNALMIFFSNTTSNTPPWSLYYYDSVSNNLCRSNYDGSGNPGDFRLVSANPITNDYTHPIFTEVDYTGTPLSNTTTIAPISIYMSFTKLQNPQVVIESGSTVDMYQIITTVTPRMRL